MIVIFKVFNIFFLLIYALENLGTVSSNFILSGSMLNFLEWVMTGGHFYMPGGVGFYVSSAPWYIQALGDIFNFGRAFFSVGDILLFLGILFFLM